MNYIALIKSGIKKMRFMGKMLYRIFYEMPIRHYKIHICPAINEFNVDLTVQYAPDSFYPAIMRKGEEKARKKTYYSSAEIRS